MQSPRLLEALLAVGMAGITVALVVRDSLFRSPRGPVVQVPSLAERLTLEAVLVKRSRREAKAAWKRAR